MWDDEDDDPYDETTFRDNPYLWNEKPSKVSAEQVKPFTSPASNYLDRGVENYMFENDLQAGTKLEHENIEDGIGLLHTFSHTISGGSVKDVENTDPVRMANLEAALEGMDFDALSGDNLIEKSLSGARLIKVVVGNTDQMGDSPYMRSRIGKDIKNAQDAAQAVRKMGGKKGGVMNEFLDGDSPEEKIGSLPTHLHRALTLVGRVKQMGTINFSSKTHVVNDEKGSKVHLEYGGLSNMEKVNIEDLTPDRILQFIGDQIPYYQEHKEKPEKRVIFALYDFSGSMYSGEKQGYVLALLINLFDAVAQGDCVVLVAPFIMDIGKIEIIDTKQKGVDYLRKFSMPCGGGTDVNGVIKKAHSLLDSGTVAGYKVGKDRAEVVVINDGEDDVDASQVPPYPTHAICLGVDNQELKVICRQSKGTYNSIMVD